MKNMISQIPPVVFKADIIYMEGNVEVPSKRISYKEDKKTHQLIAKEKPQSREFEEQLKKNLKEELKGVDIFPTKEEVLIDIEVGYNSLSKYKKCDLDNRAKTILDSMNNVVYKDDSQVRFLWVNKKYLENSQECYFVIRVKILTASLINRIERQLKISIR